MKKATDNKKNSRKVSKEDFAKKINIIMGSIVGISCIAIVSGILISYYISSKKPNEVLVPNIPVNVNKPSTVVPVDNITANQPPKVQEGEGEANKVINTNNTDVNVLNVDKINNVKDSTKKPENNQDEKVKAVN